ncbi:hypothetical protein D3C76_1558420 [compost metagenome]
MPYDSNEGPMDCIHVIAIIIMLNPATARLLYCTDFNMPGQRMERCCVYSSSAIMEDAQRIRDADSRGVPYLNISSATNSVVNVVPIFPPRIMPKVRA